MSSPSSVCNRDLGNKDLVKVDRRRSDLLAETGDFADFLEKDDFTRFIAISTETSRVVTTVLFTSETATENLQNLLAILLIAKSELKETRKGVVR